MLKEPRWTPSKDWGGNLLHWGLDEEIVDVKKETKKANPILCNHHTNMNVLWAPMIHHYLNQAIGLKIIHACISRSRTQNYWHILNPPSCKLISNLLSLMIMAIRRLYKIEHQSSIEDTWQRQLTDKTYTWERESQWEKIVGYFPLHT